MSAAKRARRCGRVAVVGRSNAGKSTLVNRLVGEKVAIVSAVPQTTRNALLGIVHGPAGQIVLVDTPGFHLPAHVLNEMMLEETNAVLEGVDAVVAVVDASDTVGRGDMFVLDRVRGLDVPHVVVLSKVDRLSDKTVLLPLIDLVRGPRPPEADEAPAVGRSAETVVPTSAFDGTGLDALKEVLFGLLPEGEPEFPQHVRTDQKTRFRVAEVIREHVLHATRQEIPHASTVIVDSLESDVLPGGRPRTVVHATILVEKPSQKGILIGRQGAMLASIGTAARRDLAALLRTRCHLQLFVKVHRDWRDDPRTLATVLAGTREFVVIEDPDEALPPHDDEE